MINTLKKQISEIEIGLKTMALTNCERMIYNMKLSTLQSCLKLAEETKEKLKEDIRKEIEIFFGKNGLSVIDVCLIDAIEKTFGETK
jgi:hypothetical protein